MRDSIRQFASTRYMKALYGFEVADSNACSVGKDGGTLRQPEWKMQIYIRREVGRLRPDCDPGAASTTSL